MSSSRFVSRGNKTRCFAYVCAFTIGLVLLYLYHGTHTKLDIVMKESDRCSHKTELLFAQLQGAIEYKLRLEKSLENEKEIHKQELEELQSTLTQVKETLNREKTETENQYNSLHQRYVLLEGENKQLTENNESVKKELLEQKEEVSKLESKLTSLLAESDRLSSTKERTIKLLQDDLNRCKVSSKDLHKDEVSSRKHPVLQDPNEAIVNENKGELSQIYNGSTTPGINPQAVIDQDDAIKQNIKSSTTTTTSSSVVKEEKHVGAVPPPAVDDKISGDSFAKEMRAAFSGGRIQLSPEADQPENVVNTPKVEKEEETNVIDAPDDKNLFEKTNNIETAGSKNDVDQKQSGINEENAIAGVKDELQKQKMFIPAPPLVDNNEVNEKYKSAKKGEKANLIGKQMRPDYNGGEYDKDMLEEEAEEDAEQEYMDNDLKVLPKPNMKPLARNQDDLNNHIGESVMVQPKDRQV